MEGPLLILAGAGSGKTSVLINRISNMVRFGDSINSGYFPSDVPREVIGLLECAVSNGEKLDFEIEKLISTGPIRPYNILAITFTNKAANEMKERVEKLIGDAAKDLWMGTFHSICVRILRRFIDRIGFDSSFIIFDTSDQKSLIKKCLKLKY